MIWNLDLNRILLGEIRPYALLPAAHPLCSERRISLRQLAEEPMVLLDAPPSREYFRKLFSFAGLQPHIAHRTRSFEMVRSLVGHGFGYSILAVKPCNRVTYDGLRLATRVISDDVAPSRFVLTHLAGRPLSRNSKLFADHCASYFARGHVPRGGHTSGRSPS